MSLPIPLFLKEIFNPKAITPPRVMVFNKDMASRGDLHGYLGIARNITEITNGAFTHLTAPELNALYPDVPHAERFDRYCQEHGYPDILLSRDAWVDYDLSKIPLRISSNNETVRRDFQVKSCQNMVPHHLTPQLLQSHGKQFREKYPSIQGELLAYFMTSAYDFEVASKKLLAKAKHHDAITIFICSYHRTPDGHPQKLTDTMKKIANEMGIANKINVVTFDYNAETKKDSDYNPYLGLLHEADHLVLEQGSTSMLSETLYAGKTVYLDYGFTIPMHTALRRKGYIETLDQNINAPFQTKPVKAFDATRKVAEAIAKKYKQQQRAKR